MNAPAKRLGQRWKLETDLGTVIDKLLDVTTKENKEKQVSSRKSQFNRFGEKCILSDFNLLIDRRESLKMVAIRNSSCSTPSRPPSIPAHKFFRIIKVVSIRRASRPVGIKCGV